jgi:hypothetical protein
VLTKALLFNRSVEQLVAEDCSDGMVTELRQSIGSQESVPPSVNRQQITKRGIAETDDLLFECLDQLNRSGEAVNIINDELRIRIELATASSKPSDRLDYLTTQTRKALLLLFRRKMPLKRSVCSTGL